MTASYDLGERVALVTGAAQGIGAACARKLAACGARVAVTDLDEAGANAVASEIREAGGDAVGLRLDVSDSAAVTTTVADVVERFGRLDIGVNNAGLTSRGAPAGDLGDADWRRILAVNLDGVFFCTRAEIAVMRGHGGGSIVNMASILGRVAFAGAAAYTASKHAVIGLMRGAAVDHAADGIRVNAVAPGFVAAARSSLDAGAIAAVERAHLLGRRGDVEEVAELVAFLSSDAASFVTASVCTVDGGYLAV